MMTRQVVMSSAGSISAIEQLHEALGSMRDVAGGPRPFSAIKEGIVFQGVDFAYAGRDVPALSNVNLIIPSKRMTALVGPSGAGKSTLIDLIPRLRVPTVGRIEIDGIPIEQFNLKQLRQSISFVPQSAVILDVTVAEHIRCGNPDASDADVIAATRLAGAYDFVMALPDQFATRIGEGGTRLSGGQRQRLDLARALARKGQILILDEPTSNLDAELEKHFRESLARLRAETELTIIVIAHHLSSIRDADQIALMDKGAVCAVGTHAELLRSNDWYASAAAHQISV